VIGCIEDSISTRDMIKLSYK